MISRYIYHALADSVVIFHLAFIVFVIFGSILVLIRPKIIWVHIPCVIWGVAIEMIGWICPLTPLENYLRAKAGVAPYSGDFVIHYIEPVLYPEALTRELQILFGILVILANVIMYGYLFLMKNKGHDMK